MNVLEQPPAISAHESPPQTNRRLILAAAILIFAFGTFVRLLPTARFTAFGPDEALYRDVIVKLDRVGLSHYPEICQLHIEDQRNPRSQAVLPPTRFFYIFCGWVAKRVAFGDAPPVHLLAKDGVARDPALVSLHRVSAIFSVLFLGLAGLVAWRMCGHGIALGVLALLAGSPLAIHMSQHAFIDGIVAFLATLCLWLLWENLQRPNHWGWLTGLAASLAVLVITKENSFFVYVALCGLVAVNRWAKFGTVTPRLVLAGIVGPALGVALLIRLAGGVEQFIEIYHLLVTKAQALTYAIVTGDGPWHRYLVESAVLEPLTLCLALGAAFTLPWKDRALRFLVGFVVFSYAIMCNVRYGMNLRYTTIWLLPMCALAAAQIFALASRAGSRALVLSVAMFAAVCGYGLRQYQIFFVDRPIYELAPEGLLRAVDMIKDVPPR